MPLLLSTGGLQLLSNSGGKGGQIYGEEQYILLSKTEIHVHICFSSSTGKRQFRQQRIYWCLGHSAIDWLSYLRDPISS